MKRNVDRWGRISGHSKDIVDLLGRLARGLSPGLSTRGVSCGALCAALPTHAFGTCHVESMHHQGVFLRCIHNTSTNLAAEDGYVGTRTRTSSCSGTTTGPSFSDATRTPPPRLTKPSSMSATSLSSAAFPEEGPYFTTWETRLRDKHFLPRALTIKDRGRMHRTLRVEAVRTRWPSPNRVCAAKVKFEIFSARDFHKQIIMGIQKLQPPSLKWIINR